MRTHAESFRSQRGIRRDLFLRKDPRAGRTARVEESLECLLQHRATEPQLAIARTPYCRRRQRCFMSGDTVSRRRMAPQVDATPEPWRDPFAARRPRPAESRTPREERTSLPANQDAFHRQEDECLWRSLSMAHIARPRRDVVCKFTLPTTPGVPTPLLPFSPLTLERAPRISRTAIAFDEYDGGERLNRRSSRAKRAL
jgi:hypothetical protein